MKYNKELISSLVKESYSYSDVIRKLGLQITGGNHNNLKNNIKKFDIDTSHFKNTTCGKIPKNKKTVEQILVNNPEAKYRTDLKQLKRALKEIGIKEICEKCGNNSTWMDNNLVLEIDHKDGNWRNNTRENLRFICPNCHSQTFNYYNRTHKSKCSCGSDKHYASKQCAKCGEKTRKKASKKRRKVERPDKNILIEQIKQYGYVGTAKLYGVSDNAIRKWL
jgi:hypothetical protein